MSDDGPDLLADFDSYGDASDSMSSANEELTAAAGGSGSEQAEAGQAMQGSPFTAEAGQALDKIHGTLDDGLNAAKEVTGADADDLTTAGKTLKAADDSVAANARDIPVTEPTGGEATPSGRIARLLSGSGDDVPDPGSDGTDEQPEPPAQTEPQGQTEPPDQPKTPERTQPSGQPDPDATPRGHPARIRPKDDAATTRSLQRENESANTLARRGYDIEQRPGVPGTKKPDYRIEGQIFDNYAPSTGDPRNIASNIKIKVDTGQTDRIILNMADSPVSLGQMSAQLHDWPIAGLKEVIAIDAQGNIVHLYP